MPVQQAGSNVVVAAHQFNPSIFSQIWLVRNEVLREDDFREGCMFSDVAVNVQSREFNLMVVPPQLQFAPKVPAEEEAELVASRVGAIIRSLPHTPYSAVGLNFIWHVTADNGEIRSLSRKLFFARESSVFREFDTGDARFGAYVSKDILGCRLKLDIKPITQHLEEQTKELLQFAFNFHLDVPEDEEDIVVSAIQEQLQRWERARQEASRIVDAAVG